MKKSSWACTLIIQFSLCFAIYIALNLGQPQKYLHRRAATNTNNGRPLDLFFISVSGGFRSLQQQTHLLNLMENVAKVYNVQFVVSISEIGEEDPLLKNATQLFSSTKIPWYTTGAAERNGFGYFIDNIKLPLGKSLDIVLTNAGLQQDTGPRESSCGVQISQLNWLTRTLTAARGDWRIVVGSRPLIACEKSKDQKEAKQVRGLLHQVLSKYGVDLYLSNKECTNSTGQDNVACIKIPIPSENEQHEAPSTEIPVKREMTNGFLLHRVSPLEFVTYLINSSGQAVDKSMIKRRSREVM